MSPIRESSHEANVDVQLELRFGDVVPTPEADAELRWFFNEAESAIDMPSNYDTMIGGASPTTAEAVEARLEAMHSAGKINRWLKALPIQDAMLLGALYTDRFWPMAVEQVLGGVAGAVESLPTVRAQYLRALISGQTGATSASAWLAELIELGGPPAVADWMREAGLACAIAVRAYECQRGSVPCVVPGEEV